VPTWKGGLRDLSGLAGVLQVALVRAQGGVAGKCLGLLCVHSGISECLVVGAAPAVEVDGKGELGFLEELAFPCRQGADLHPFGEPRGATVRARSDRVLLGIHPERPA